MIGVHVFAWLGGCPSDTTATYDRLRCCIDGDTSQGMATNSSSSSNTFHWDGMLVPYSAKPIAPGEVEGKTQFLHHSPTVRVVYSPKRPNRQHSPRPLPATASSSQPKRGGVSSRKCALIIQADVMLMPMLHIHILVLLAAPSKQAGRQAR